MVKNKVSALKILNKTLIFLLCIAMLTFATYGVVIGVQKKYFYPLKYKQEVMEYCALYNVKPQLIFATIKVESSFNVNAKSSKGAVGLMQITLKTAEFIAQKLSVQKYDLLNPKTNIQFGCYYLKYLLNKFNSEDVAICAFNAGEGNVLNWLNNKEYSKDGKSLYNIPFKETKEHLLKTQKSLSKYEKLYGNFLDK